MKNRSLSFSLTGRTKFFLFTCLGAAAVVDFSAFLYLVIAGISLSYWIYPLLFFIADAIFIIEALLSNYRFKYTIIQIIFYLAFSFVVFMNMSNALFSKGFVEFTDYASAIWTVFHIFSPALVLSCYIYTAKLSKRALPHTVISLIFAALSTLAAFVYAVSILAVGFFGQGAYTRPLYYTYSEERDAYEVMGVLDGNGKQVYIPAEFNGKKVDRVSCTVFIEYGIESVTLDCAADVEFTDYYVTDKPDPSCEIYAPKENLDIFKRALYDKDAAKFANAMRPYNLESDEVYATFNYGAEQYKLVDGEIFDTWYGKKGDKLTLSHYKDISYAAHADANSDEDLYWNFEHNDRRILTLLDCDGKNVIESEITENISGVEVKFEEICRLYPDGCNDDMYSLSQNFKFSEVQGRKLSYKLSTASGVSSYLASYKRSGFTLSTNVTGKEIKYVEFIWELDTPSVVATSDKENNIAVYGESVNLSATAQSAAEGAVFRYEWYDGTAVKSTLQTCSIAEIPYGNASYEVRVTVKSNFTSLTATGYATIDMTVERRPLTIGWSLPESSVYEGANKEIRCAINESPIGGDSVSLDRTSFVCRDAGTTVFTVALTGNSREKYSIVSGQSQTFTIEKADLTVDWTADELVYSGETQRPEFSLVGLQGDDALKNYSLTGGANVGSYNTRLIITDAFIKNYNLKNDNVTLKITPYPLNVVWASSLPDTFVYDGNVHSISASANGAQGKPVSLNYSIASIKDVGDYTVKASISNKNYEIVSGATHTYKITPYGLSVNWSQTTLTYNGRTQSPAYRLTGIGGDGNLTGGGSGAKKDVGEGYVFTLTDVNNKNYYIADNASTEYKITRASVAVSWNVPRLTYNGKTQSPTARVVGLGEDAGVALNCTVTGAVNAGTHVSEATLEHELAKNYTLTDTRRSFTIDKRLVHVTVDDVKITYGEAVPETFNYSVTQVAEGDNENEVVTNVKFEIAGYSGGYALPKTYNIYATADVDGNYSFVTDMPAGKLIVEKAKLSLKIDDKQIALGDDLPEFTFTVTAGAIVGGDAIIVTFKLDRPIDGAGEYKIMPNRVDNYDKYDCGISYGTLTVTEG